ncbi:hypothetical protein C0J50_5543 [Silurus asotus]|uniref:Uncharacterized protein n=1 Tax=Silurus asotus TaxID=30991 RepID=A0AAD5A676_SILAS|nr:hypothetical protein C0J50_5543 [Silurus asotus]
MTQDLDWAIALAEAVDEVQTGRSRVVIGHSSQERACAQAIPPLHPNVKGRAWLQHTYVHVHSETSGLPGITCSSTGNSDSNKQIFWKSSLMTPGFSAQAQRRRN